MSRKAGKFTPKSLLVPGAGHTFDAVDEVALQESGLAGDAHFWQAPANFVEHHRNFAAGQVGTQTEVWPTCTKTNL